MMTGGRLPRFVLAALLLLQACSPVYEYRAAAGHLSFLAHRRSLDSAISDPGTPPPLRAKLRLAQDIRRFAFDRVGLKRSHAYSTYSPVQGEALTWLVSGSKKTSFTPYEWSFFLVGTFPYEGHWKRRHAEDEQARLEKKGWDACIVPAAAYNTPLPISDPIPSTLLAYPAGDLAETLLHEWTHDTVYYKDQTDFDEALAVFVGRQAAEQFLAERFGPESEELGEYRRSRKQEDAYDDEMDRLYDRLDAVYRSTATEEEKLREREPIFEEGRKAFEKLGRPIDKLNNAVILASRLYHARQDLFERAFEAHGRDWPKTLAFFKSLDKRDPFKDLQRRAGATARSGDG